MWQRIVLPDVGFSASADWIGSVLEQAQSYPASCFQTNDQISSCLMLSVLYNHESLRSEGDYISRLRNTLGEADLSARQLMGLASCDKVSRFVGLATSLTGYKLVCRRGDARIFTKNEFSRNFKPPSAERASAAFRVLLGKISAAVRASDGGCELLGTALAAYFITLTLHPFVDGNGRSARMYFSSQILRLRQDRLIHLLALPVLHRDRGTRFHMAAKVARLGSFGAFFDLYQESVHFVRNSFQEELMLLAAIDEEGEQMKKMSTLLEIRRRMAKIVLGFSE